MARDCGFIYETDNKKPNPTKLSANSKDVGCRSNFDPSRPLYTQDTSFSVKSSLTVVRQGAKVPSSDIFAKEHWNERTNEPNANILADETVLIG